jgi:peptidoglycan-associated lipoprotein
MRITTVRVWVTMLVAVLLLAAGCKKNTPVPVAASTPPEAPPVKVATPPPPGPKPILPAVIDSFTAEPASIERGQAATLRWAVSNATNITIDQGLGTIPAQGSRQVFPGSTITYTLTATGANGASVTRAVTVDVIVPPAPPPPPPTKPQGPDVITRLRQESQEVYFDYDMSELREDARRALNINADLLRSVFAADPSLIVVIEGHCDERGSAEYNLGLGDRRATAARDYLVQLGVPANRLRTISFGEERPQCTDPNESCYQQNRRAHLEPAQ